MVCELGGNTMTLASPIGRMWPEETPVERYVHAAKLAREHARMWRALASSGVYRQHSLGEVHARECFSRAYDYLQAARDIKGETSEEWPEHFDPPIGSSPSEIAAIQRLK